jgi:hypothetical protein
MTPRPKKITAVLRTVRDTLRASRHLSVQAAVTQVNPIVRVFRHNHVPKESLTFAPLAAKLARDG